MSTLDPSSPLVLDARTLGRRAGSMKKLDFSVAAPADLGVGLIAVPPGSEIEFDIRLEAVIDGVLVTGSALLTDIPPLIPEAARLNLVTMMMNNRS